MKHHRSQRLSKLRIRFFTGLSMLAAALIGGSGCATGTLTTMRAERYRIEVSLDPATHHVVGRTVLDLVRDAETEPTAADRTGVELLLHPDLRITRVASSAGGAVVRPAVSKRPKDSGEFEPRRHLVSVPGQPWAVTLFVDYEGTLHQDPAAGEKAGEIHNFAMRAHVGTDGIYLADGFWYPQPARPEDDPRPLAEFTMVADPIPDVELVASGESDPGLAERTGRLAWRSPYPLNEMVLVGGAHRVFHSTHNGVDITAHVKVNQTVHADGLLDAVRRNLDRYEPLIGRYPAREYRVVDNFFSSGFAFPTFTLLSSAVIDMGRRSQVTHGYLDHEMLHSWWGNGVFVDPRDGNWCEALASYAANYYGHVLDGNEAEARRVRRNASHFLTRIEPDKDLPLGTYGQDGGCGRGIAYQKGAMIFNMLARKVGQENFWSAMRQLTADYTGRYASWADIQHVCEASSGVPLDAFVRQWVRGGGAPTLAIDAARFDTGNNTLHLTISQGEPAFELDVPVRITHAEGATEETLVVSAAVQEVAIPLTALPTSVEIDPEYQIFRKVPLGDIVPTTTSTRTGHAFASVLPAGEAPGAYKTMASIFGSSFEEGERVGLAASDLGDGALAGRCVLVLGQAVLDPYVAAYLSAVEFPVRFTETGFEFDGETYHEPDDAVLCTIRHPDVEGGGITVVFANSDDSIPSAYSIPFYDNSLVIFKNKTPALRRDFERRAVVAVQ